MTRMRTSKVGAEQKEQIDACCTRALCWRVWDLSFDGQEVENLSALQIKDTSWGAERQEEQSALGEAVSRRRQYRLVSGRLPQWSLNDISNVLE